MTQGNEVEVSSKILIPLMNDVDQDAWISETVRNGIQYGASMVVLGPVWDAVKWKGNYPVGIWTDSVFTPEEMADYLPKVGEKDGEGGQTNFNFHAGSRLSILKWSDFAVVSRPDPTKPDDIFVTFLYQSDDGAFRVHQWENGPASVLGMQKVVHVDDLTDSEIEMLGFDPAEVIYDEGWVNRLAEGKKGGFIDPDSIPVVCFILVGRGEMRDTWQGETGKGRPITRSEVNDRFWKTPITIWAWEFQTPDQRDKWLTEPPGDGIGWKVDSSHQWRQLYGLSQVVETGREKELIEYEHSVMLDDGTLVEFFVFAAEEGKKVLDNSVYGAARGGGYVIDFQGENYHGQNGSTSLRQWGVWNKRVAERTIVRVIPPVWTEGTSGVQTDLPRKTLQWKQGPSQISIETKVSQWQKECRELLNSELSGLRELMSGTSIQMDSADITRDLSDLAAELGPLYTRRERRLIQSVYRARERRKRRKRESMVCPECGQKLPFPGHHAECSLKPAPRPTSEVKPGKDTHKGEKDDQAGGRNEGEVEKTKTEEVEVEVPSVTFPKVEAANWSDLPEGRGFAGISWEPEYDDGTHRGCLKVAWGATPDERYPALNQAFDRLCDKYGVASDNHAAKDAIERALWTALVRLLSGKYAHFMGQLEDLPKDSPALEVRQVADHQIMVSGMTMALYGIQDLERFATPILSHTLGSALAQD